MPSIPADLGIVFVDHGSKRGEANAQLLEVVELFRQSTGAAIVEPAHMELAPPSIADAFDACVAAGAKRVICFPFFLSPGRHWHQDIPDLVKEAATKHPGVEWLVTAPIGLHPLLNTIINDRIEQCARHASGSGNDCPLCTGTDRCTFQKTNP